MLQLIAVAIYCRITRNKRIVNILETLGALVVLRFVIAKLAKPAEAIY
jgi:hypothetical protein